MPKRLNVAVYYGGQSVIEWAVQIHFRHGFQCRAAVALFPARESEA
jgi:hypothetical protein